MCPCMGEVCAVSAAAQLVRSNFALHTLLPAATALTVHRRQQPSLLLLLPVGQSAVERHTSICESSARGREQRWTRQRIRRSRRHRKAGMAMEVLIKVWCVTALRNAFLKCTKRKARVLVQVLLANKVWLICIWSEWVSQAPDACALQKHTYFRPSSRVNAFSSTPNTQTYTNTRTHTDLQKNGLIFMFCLFYIPLYAQLIGSATATSRP